MEEGDSHLKVACALRSKAPSAVRPLGGGNDKVRGGNDKECSCHEKNYQCSLLYVVCLLNF